MSKGPDDFLTGRVQLRSVAPMAVRLVVRHGGSVNGPDDQSAYGFTYEFEQGRIVIGRGKGADVRLPDRSVSEHHATLERTGAQHTLRDEGSTNGTRVGEATLVAARPRQLQAGDVIEIGNFLLNFEVGPLRSGVTPPERTASLARSMLRELLGPEHPATTPPRLTVIEGPDAGLSVKLGGDQASLVIGRAEAAGLRLCDEDASREHVEILRDADGAIARDLGSKNGLVVNGRLMRERRLRHGDLLTVGRDLVLFEDPAEQAIKDLDSQGDLTIARTLARASAQPRTLVPSSTSAVQAQALSHAMSARSPMDAMVYGMAAFLLMASLLGLVWLFA